MVSFMAVPAPAEPGRYIATPMLQTELIGRNDVSERDLFLLNTASISEVPNTLGLSSKYFGVLLVAVRRPGDVER